MRIVGILAILILFPLSLFSSTTGSTYADSSETVYTLSAGERLFNVSYKISNSTVERIYVKLPTENPYEYSFVVDFGNSTKTGGTLTMTVPSELMASVCQSNFLITKPIVVIDNSTFGAVIDILSSTGTNITFLVNLPPFAKTVEVGGYGPDPMGGCPTSAYKLIQGGKVFWIDYKSDPEIRNIIMNGSGPSLVVTVGNGYRLPPQPPSFVDIQIPRDLLDSKMSQEDIPFIVTVDGNKTQIREIETTNTTRTIHVPLPSAPYYADRAPGKIVITGTTAVPEFPFTNIVWLVGIALAIVLSGAKKLSWNRVLRIESYLKED